MKFRIILLCLFVVSCSLETQNSVPVSFSVTKQIAVTGTSDDTSAFNCFFVNVRGPGIFSQVDSTFFGDVQPECLTPGALTDVKLISSTESIVNFKINLPAGKDRNIQILAFRSNIPSTITDTLGSLCPFSSLSQYFPGPGRVPANAPEIYEVGYANHVEVYQNTHLDLLSSYNANSANLVHTCNSSN